MNEDNSTKDQKRSGEQDGDESNKAIEQQSNYTTERQSEMSQDQ
jgi:hypothetical protein